MNVKYIILSVITFVLLFSVPMQAKGKCDTIRARENCQFKAKDLIVPGALIAVGASSMFLTPMKDFDHSLNKEFVKMRGNNHRISIDEYLRFSPYAVNYALHFSGVGSGYDTREQLLLTATSFATMYALTQGLKHTVNKTRPDGSDNHSFPSGHVATAFLGAEQLRMNYGTWWGLAGYTAATATAFLRLYNNRHWLGDVISGAGIGILSAHIGYWLLPFEKRILGLDKKRDTNDKSILALPTYNPSNKTYGLALAIQF